MPEHREGGCQCGAVRYRINGAPLTLYLCHCKECQKQASSAFGMSLWLRRADLEHLSEAPKFWTRKADSGREVVCAFCPDCGSRLYHAESHDSEIVSLKAGSLDDTSWLRPVGHVWAKSKQPWVEIAESPPALVNAEQPASMDPYIRRWKAENPGL